METSRVLIKWNLINILFIPGEIKRNFGGDRNETPHNTSDKKHLLYEILT